MDLAAELALEASETVERDHLEQDRRQVAVVQRQVGPRDEHALVGCIRGERVLAHDRVRREEVLPLLDQRDDRDAPRREVAEQLAQRLVTLEDPGVRRVRDEALVVTARALELTGRRAA